MDSLEDKENLQRDSDVVESRVVTNCVQFSKIKCLILHLEEGNSSSKQRLGNKRIERDAQKKIGLDGQQVEY